MAQQASQKKSKEDNQEFESDTQKIIHRHLENKDDVISEDDIRNVRIGMVPPDAAIANEQIEEREEKVNEEISAADNENTTGQTPDEEPISLLR